MIKRIISLIIFMLVFTIIYADWEPINSPRTGCISKVVIDRNNENIMYAINYGKVYKTIDNGNSWYIALESTTDNLGIFNVAPNNEDVIYTKEWKSIDKGESWFQITRIPIGNNIWGSQDQLAINPNNPDILFTVDYLTGIYKSTNGGQSWDFVQNSYSIQIAYDFLTPTKLYSIGCHYAYKSNDGGNTWDQVYTLGDSLYFYGNLIIDYHNLYCLIGSCGIENMIGISTDEGNSWTLINIDPTIEILNFTIENGTIYAATNNGLYSTTDSGLTWDRISADYDYLLNVDVYNKILVGSNKSGVSLSQIMHDIWKNIGIKKISSYETKIITSTNGTTICNSHSGIYKYLPDTQEWRTMIPPVGSEYPYYSAVEISKFNPDNIFAVIADKLFISYDSGEEWFLLNDLPTNINSKIVSTSPDELKIFISMNESILRSLNVGLSWSTKQIPGSMLYDLHYSDDDVLYIFDDTGYYYSNNNGNSWTSLDSNLPLDSFILSN